MDRFDFEHSGLGNEPAGSYYVSVRDRFLAQTLAVEHAT